MARATGSRGRRSSPPPGPEDVEVAFDRSSLVRVGGVGFLMLLAAVALLVLDEWRPGVPAPLWLRAPLAGLAALLGGWFLVAVSRRLRSDDPAIRIDASVALFHVSPGRRVLLRHDEITGVGEVEEVHGLQRAVIGDRQFLVATTREEGFWASSTLVGSRFVEGDLGTVRDLVSAALVRGRDGQRGQTP